MMNTLTMNKDDTAGRLAKYYQKMKLPGFIENPGEMIEGNVEETKDGQAQHVSFKLENFKRHPILQEHARLKLERKLSDKRWRKEKEEQNKADRILMAKLAATSAMLSLREDKRGKVAKVVENHLEDCKVYHEKCMEVKK